MSASVKYWYLSRMSGGIDEVNLRCQSKGVKDGCHQALKLGPRPSPGCTVRNLRATGPGRAPIGPSASSKHRPRPAHTQNHTKLFAIFEIRPVRTEQPHTSLFADLVEGMKNHTGHAGLVVFVGPIYIENFRPAQNGGIACWRIAQRSNSFWTPRKDSRASADQ